MKKSIKTLWLMIFICFGLMIITFSCLGTTYAKFVSRVSSSTVTKMSGFYIEANGSSSSEIKTTTFIAPGDTKSLSIPITYFSQVNTKFTVVSETSIVGTGFLADFNALLTEYETYKATHNSSGKAPASLNEMFTITYDGSTDIVSIIINELVKQGLSDIQGYGVSAMSSDATTALVISIPITITWVEHNDPDWDTWDTFIGSKFYQTSVASTISLSMAVCAEQMT